MNIKAVLFDVDDTLFDRELAQKKVLDLMVERFPRLLGGFEMSHLLRVWEEADRLALADFDTNTPSTTLRDTRSRQFLRLLDIQEDIVDGLVDIYLKDYPGINAPVEGAADLVRRLSPGYKIGVISNSLPDLQYGKLETLGIRDLFACIVLSEELGIRKPDPRIFHHAAGLLRVHPSECLYVGDSYKADVIGAKAAGMLSCWFKRSKPLLPENPVTADFEIDRLEELAKILELPG